MKSLAITALITLGFATQAIAESDADVAPTFNLGATPELAQKHVPKYDIVTAKVAQGITTFEEVLKNAPLA